jgi:citrate lyase beta subunit
VLEAAAATEGGAVAVAGSMIDQPVVLKARAILAELEQPLGSESDGEGSGR